MLRDDAPDPGASGPQRRTHFGGRSAGTCRACGRSQSPGQGPRYRECLAGFRRSLGADARGRQCDGHGSRLGRPCHRLRAQQSRVSRHPSGESGRPCWFCRRDRSCAPDSGGDGASANQVPRVFHRHLGHELPRSPRPTPRSLRSSTGRVRMRLCFLSSTSGHGGANFIKGWNAFTRPMPSRSCRDSCGRSPGDSWDSHSRATDSVDGPKNASRA